MREVKKMIIKEQFLLEDLVENLTPALLVLSFKGIFLSSSMHTNNQVSQ
jgi:hypothetical protein